MLLPVLLLYNEHTMKKTVTIIILLLVVLLGYMFYQNKQQADINQYNANKIQNLEREIDDIEDADVIIDIETEEDGGGDLDDIEDVDYAETMTVRFPVSYGDVFEENYVYVGATVPKSPAVLNASYRAMFAAPSAIEVFEGVVGANRAPDSNLMFDRAEISDNSARVYLTGTFYTMEIANLIFRNQVNKIALQYETVDTVSVYVNGLLFDWCDYDESGGEEGSCAEGPDFWIAAE